MKPEEIIREGRELCEKATPGPWTADRFEMLVPPNEKWSRKGLADTVSEEDAAFIARARTLLPAALDALKEATKRNKQLEGVIKKGVKAMDAASELIGVTAAPMYAELWERVERAEAALAEADDTIRLKEQLRADAQSSFEQASTERDQWMALVGADARHNTPEQNEAIYDDIEDAIKRHRAAKGRPWANVGKMIRDGIAAESELAVERTITKSATGECQRLRAALAKTEAELEQTREAGATALAHVVLLSERAEKAEAERDELRREICRSESAASHEEFRACWGEPLSDVLRHTPDANRPIEPREVALRRWPDAADRLFPDEVKSG